jgi:hypothetical protein
MTPVMGMALALRTLPDPAPTSEVVLFESVVVRMSKTGDHLCIKAINEGRNPIDDTSVAAVLDASERLLSEAQSFKTTWDLIECPVPSPAIVVRCSRWAFKHKRNLDRLNTRLAVVISTNTAILKIVQTVLSVFGPKCPTKVTACREEARTFMSA